jgi:hypothetical protein
VTFPNLTDDGQGDGAASTPTAQFHPRLRYLDIQDDDQRDQELAAHWIRQASKLPGWVP